MMEGVLRCLVCGLYTSALEASQRIHLTGHCGGGELVDQGRYHWRRLRMYVPRGERDAAIAQLITNGSTSYRMACCRALAESWKHGGVLIGGR